MAAPIHVAPASVSSSLLQGPPLTPYTPQDPSAPAPIPTMPTGHFGNPYTPFPFGYMPYLGSYPPYPLFAMLLALNVPVPAATGPSSSPAIHMNVADG